MAFSTRELFARIIKCEAGGEGETGMKAVACVLMNRVNVPYGEYQRMCQGDLRKVITQPGQFDCMRGVLGGQINTQNVWASPPDEVHYAIADWALSGHKLWEIGQALWYFNPFNPSCPPKFPYNGTGSIINRIGEHCFYIPTSRYRKT